MNKKHWLEMVVVIAITGFIMLFHLGGLPLLDPDEPVYAETAKQMILSNDWLSPRIYGDFWYDKPPMYYWLVATAFSVFGQTEFAARLPSALLAIGGTLMVYRAGRQLFSPMAGFFAALILATSMEYFYLGKAAVTDMTLTFWLTAALISFLQKRYDRLSICAALAVVTKGPIGLLFPGCIIVLYWLLTKNHRALRQIPLLRSITLFTVISIPWYIYMYLVHGMDFINTFLGFHNITRFLQPEHADGKLWYYYIPVLLIGFFPWTAFLVQACRKAWQQPRLTPDQPLLFLLVWATFIFAFFSMSQTKLVSYILPLYPPLALLVGWYIDKTTAEGHFQSFRYSLGILTVLGIAVISGLILYGESSDRQLLPALLPTAAVFGIMIVCSWLSAYKKREQHLIASLVGGITCFVIILMTTLFPLVAQNFSTRDIAGEFSRLYDGQTPVYVEKFYRPSFAFYTGVPGIEVNGGDQVAKVLTNSGTALLLVKERSYAGLSPELLRNVQVISQKNGKVLLQKSSDASYVVKKTANQYSELSPAGIIPLHK